LSKLIERQATSSTKPMSDKDNKEEVAISPAPPAKKKEETPGWKKGLFVAGMLTFGTCTVVTQKITFNLPADQPKKFTKPWMQTDLMFLGMFACLAVYEIFNLVQYLRKRHDAKKLDEERAPLTAGDASIQKENKKEDSSMKHWKTYLRVIAPAMCDLTATMTMNVGLLWINASIWQMLRGSMIIFSAILAIVWHKRRLYAFNWLGIFNAITALLVVGVASINLKTPPGRVEESVDQRYAIEGVILVVVAQVIQATQIVIEEILLKSVKAPALFIVGIEGLWGFVICSGVLLPIVGALPDTRDWKGIREDTMDSFQMMFSHSSIIGANIFYVIVILLYNWFGMEVTHVFTAVHRTILEAGRTACIWIVNLIIYYGIDNRFGENWQTWSFMELFGFLVLTCGTLIYNRIVHLPYLYYPPTEDYSLPTKKDKEEKDSGSVPKEMKTTVADRDDN